MFRVASKVWPAKAMNGSYKARSVWYLTEEELEEALEKVDKNKLEIKKVE